ncbi:hypothetical protein KIH74_25455 [Kineosporia sp. J2-2]|uniref:Uncharacterized protein n=1 Tax=Kineosporia corallincola TaxID=2835133 RepID=A0ABS5TMJ9_9ACTN|nr:hypothetical protein [Kineosporia corallincola]MBT0772317.1 hypothetical protein [Kineosporia corallincola]
MKPRRQYICLCRNDGDRHARWSEGCTGGDPLVSRAKPWGPDDEAERALRLARKAAGS